jgi:hypothetical protein
VLHDLQDFTTNQSLSSCFLDLGTGTRYDYIGHVMDCVICKNIVKTQRVLRSQPFQNDDLLTALYKVPYNNVLIGGSWRRYTLKACLLPNMGRHRQTDCCGGGRAESSQQISNDGSHVLA